MTALLQTGDHFIEGAVAAAGHDQIRFTRVCPGKIHRVPALFRYINRTEVSRLVEDGNHLGKETAALAGSGIGIDDQVERLQFRVHNTNCMIIMLNSDKEIIADTKRKTNS